MPHVLPNAVYQILVVAVLSKTVEEARVHLSFSGFHHHVSFVKVRTLQDLIKCFFGNYFSGRPSFSKLGILNVVCLNAYVLIFWI